MSNCKQALRAELQPIAKAFFDNPKIQEIQILPGGHIHTTLKVTISSGNGQSDYIFQKMNTQVFPHPEGIMENIRQISDFLSTVQKPTPYQLGILRPEKTREGNPGLRFGDTYWRVFPFFANALCLNVAKTSEIAGSAGKAFGHFARHLTGMRADLLEETIVGFHSGRFRIQQFKEALKADQAGRLAKIPEIVQSCQENLVVLETFDQIREDLPKRVIHHDAKLNNVLLDKNTLAPIAVIDLDTVMSGSILSDFGDLVRSLSTHKAEDEVTNHHEINMDFFDALSREFLKECGSCLNSTELEHLVFGAQAITFMVAIRFLTDYLNGDHYFKIAFPDQNLKRAEGQLSLFHSLQIKETDMNRLIQQLVSTMV